MDNFTYTRHRKLVCCGKWRISAEFVWKNIYALKYHKPDWLYVFCENFAILLTFSDTLHRIYSIKMQICKQQVFLICGGLTYLLYILYNAVD